MELKIFLYYLKKVLNDTMETKKEIKQKTCFVIMGFGKKKDPISNRTIDLDSTFKKIIKPAVTKCGYKCIRADEILDSGLIDRSMYALLYCAELVIADISTHNPNAIYELGVRHTFKPYSTIIIKEDECNIPFDFNHNRMLSYKHLGNEISKNEAKKSVKDLCALIDKVSNNPIVDSPLYTFIPKIKQPVLSEEDLQEIIGDLSNKENTVYSLQEKAKNLMKESNFLEAASKWEQLSKIVKNEPYFIQQQSLCIYKSQHPTELKALIDASNLISTLHGENDTETLGINGAINKRLWKLTADIASLDSATELYKRGWSLYKDYYTGDNYAYCIEQKSILETDVKKKIYYQVEAEEVRKQIIEVVLQTLEQDEIEEKKWKYATLSNSYRALQDVVNADKYEALFLQENPLKWEVDTFSSSKDDINRFWGTLEKAP